MAKLNPRQAAIMASVPNVQPGQMEALEAQIAAIQADTTVSPAIKQLITSNIEAQLAIMKQLTKAQEALKKAEDAASAEEARKASIKAGPFAWFEAPGSNENGAWPAKVALAPHANATWKYFFRTTPEVILALIGKSPVDGETAHLTAWRQAAIDCLATHGPTPARDK